METTETSKEPTKNLHIEVPEGFHRRVKMLCAMQGRKLKEFAFQALQEKVERDESDLAASRK